MSGTGRTHSPRDVIHAALAAGMPNGPGVTEPMRTRFAEVAVIETDNVLAALAEAGYTLVKSDGEPDWQNKRDTCNHAMTTRYPDGMVKCLTCSAWYDEPTTPASVQPEADQ